MLRARQAALQRVWALRVLQRFLSRVSVARLKPSLTCCPAVQTRNGFQAHVLTAHPPRSGWAIGHASLTACTAPGGRHLDCVDYLLTAGADATLVTFTVRRETALHLAAGNAHSACAARLLDASVPDPSGASRRLANIVSVNVRHAPSPLHARAALHDCQ
jgi:hypothetical protein